jgi:hypothetical protein
MKAVLWIVGLVVIAGAINKFGVRSVFPLTQAPL